jgi:Tol biopolymer transport system component
MACAQEPHWSEGDHDNLYLRYLHTGARVLLSTPDGTTRANGDVRSIAVSPDGNRIAFATSATNLGPVDSNGHDDLYVLELRTDTFTIATASATGRQRRGWPSSPSFSPDSRSIASELASRPCTRDRGPATTS